MDRTRKKRTDSVWKRILLGIITIVIRFWICIFRGVWKGIKAFFHNLKLGLQNLAADLRAKDLETWSGVLFWIFLMIIFGAAIL